MRDLTSLVANESVPHAMPGVAEASLHGEDRPPAPPEPLEVDPWWPVLVVPPLLVHATRRVTPP